MITTSAPGKLILTGEYAVLDGAPALVTAVDRRVRVTVSGRSNGYTLSAPLFGLANHPFTIGCESSGLEELGVVRAVVEAVSEGASLPPVAITIDTSPFYQGEHKLGLGSSAAVAVALSGALLGAALSAPDPPTLFAFALAAHRRAQGGVGSGVDVAASVFGGVLRYELDQLPVSTRLPDGLAFLPVWTGRSASTTALVGAVKRAIARGDAEAEWQRLVDLTRRDINDANGFVATVDYWCQALDDLGRAAGVDLVTNEHRAIGDIVRGAGGAYKPSGAGGGDFGLAVACSVEVLAQIEVALDSAGFAPLRLVVEPIGFLVE